jgi:hypothetical protein
MDVMSKTVKSALGGVLSTILLNPYVLLIIVIFGIIILAVAIGAIIFYGLTTALVLFAISGLALVFLHYIHVINLSEVPILMTIPPSMFAIGYVTERLNLFSVQSPLSTMSSTSFVTFPQGALIVEIITAALIITAIVVIAKRR